LAEFPHLFGTPESRDGGGGSWPPWPVRGRAGPWPGRAGARDRSKGALAMPWRPWPGSRNSR